MRFLLLVKAIYFVYIFNLSISEAYVYNVDENGNEISMKNILPLFRPYSASEELSMKKQFDESIKKANMTTLLRIIQWASGLQEELLELKMNVTKEGARDFHGTQLTGPPEEIEAYINETIDFLKGYERTVEDELRKPSKTWNYPTKGR